MSLKKQDDPTWSQVLGMQLTMLEHSTDASRRVRTSAARASSMSWVLICWSCHSTNATLGTLKPSVSSDDECVPHRGRRVQKRCGSCTTLLAPMTHMNSCWWGRGPGLAPPLDQSAPRHPDRCAPHVGYPVFPTKFEHQCSVLCIRRRTGGFCALVQMWYSTKLLP